MATKQFTDAITLLKADHRKVENLFEQFEKTQAASRKQSLAHEICTELKIHTAIEEEIFYPAFRERSKTIRSMKPMLNMTAQRS
jgi:hemerythrin superfamily protein